MRVRTIAERIVEYVELHPGQSGREIAASLDATHSAVYAALSNLARDGLLSRRQHERPSGAVYAYWLPAVVPVPEEPTPEVAPATVPIDPGVVATEIAPVAEAAPSSPVPPLADLEAEARRREWKLIGRGWYHLDGPRVLVASGGPVTDGWWLDPVARAADGTVVEHDEPDPARRLDAALTAWAPEDARRLGWWQVVDDGRWRAPGSEDVLVARLHAGRWDWWSSDATIRSAPDEPTAVRRALDAWLRHREEADRPAPEPDAAAALVRIADALDLGDRPVGPADLDLILEVIRAREAKSRHVADELAREKAAGDEWRRKAVDAVGRAADPGPCPDTHVDVYLVVTDQGVPGTDPYIGVDAYLTDENGDLDDLDPTRQVLLYVRVPRNRARPLPVIDVRGAR